MFTNQDAVNFIDKFATLESLHGFTFVMELNRSLAALEAEIKLCEKLRKPSPEYGKYQAESQGLFKKFSEKDAAGNPKLEMIGEKLQRFVIPPEAGAALAKAIASLDKAHSGPIDIQTKKNEDYREAMKAECKAKINKIKKGDIPKDINAGQLRLLFSVGLVE